jgi:hypothetical protein
MLEYPSWLGKAGLYHHRRFKMGDTIKGKKRWFLKAELGGFAGSDLEKGNTI